MYGQGRLTPTTLATLQECGLDAVLQGLPADIRPPALLVLEPFALTPIESTKVVLVGQDPFPDGAMGLAFSKKRGHKVENSTANIYDCIRHTIGGADPSFRLFPGEDHTDLTAWAKRGVLCINAALTMANKSGDQMKDWQDFTAALLRKLAARHHVQFIALGGFAQKLMAGIVPINRIHAWSHPSPMVSANKDHSNPTAFHNATVWLTAQQQVQLHDAQSTFTWSLCAETAFNVRTEDLPQEVPDDPCKIWLFTDGSATQNGYAGCRASWAYHMTDGVTYYEASAECAPIIIPGKTYKSSNQRGELTACLKGLEHILYEAQNKILPAVQGIVLVTDSMYCINMLDGGQTASCNVDLIQFTRNILGDLRALLPVEFVHQKAHMAKKNAPQEGTYERFLYLHNDRVDKLAAAALTT